MRGGGHNVGVLKRLHRGEAAGRWCERVRRGGVSMCAEVVCAVHVCVGWQVERGVLSGGGAAEMGAAGVAMFTVEVPKPGLLRRCRLF